CFYISASSTQVNGNDQGAWSTVVRKKSWQSSSTSHDMQTKKGLRSARPVLVTQNVGDGKFKAASDVSRKFAFHMDNIAAPCSVDDISSHLSDAGIRVVTCNQAKSRTRAHDNSTVASF